MPDIYLIYCSIRLVSDASECPVEYFEADHMFELLESPLDYIPNILTVKEMFCCNMTF